MSQKNEQHKCLCCKRYEEESLDIEQILGDALGYPKWRTKNPNFVGELPDGYGDDYVDIGDETPITLAAFAAFKLEQNATEIEKLKTLARRLYVAARDGYYSVLRAGDWEQDVGLQRTALEAYDAYLANPHADLAPDDYTV